MSSALLKKAIDAEFQAIEKRSTKQTKKFAKDEAPTNRHGIKKKIAKANGSGKSRAGSEVSLRRALSKSTYSGQSASSDHATRAKSNVEALLTLSEGKVNSKAAKTILDHVVREKRSFDRAPAVERKRRKNKTDDSERSVFSDRDFESWKKAYFINSKLSVPKGEEEDF